MLEIVLYPDPVLKKKAVAVSEGDEGLKELEELVAGMLEAMKAAHGVGLAAPQVGRSLRVFVASESGDVEDALVFINPEVEPFGKVIELEEGCLSIPEVRADVSRPSLVRVTWTGLDGQRQKGEFGELFARIIQHEFDHLEGFLFVDRLVPTDRLRVRPGLEALEEQFQPR